MAEETRLARACKFRPGVIGHITSFLLLYCAFLGHTFLNTTMISTAWAAAQDRILIATQKNLSFTAFPLFLKVRFGTCLISTTSNKI